MLSARTLAAIQTSVLKVLTDTCDVRRATEADDPGRGARGGEILTWATATAGLACHVGHMGEGDEILVAERLTGRQGYWLRAPKDSDVRISDRILYAGDLYEVVAVLTPVTQDFMAHFVLARLT